TRYPTLFGHGEVNAQEKLRWEASHCLTGLRSRRGRRSSRQGYVKVAVKPADQLGEWEPLSAEATPCRSPLRAAAPTFNLLPGARS
ncbi:MAG: hypothetical protein ACRD2L_24750, partial [Terriglobia bacterium]